MFAPTLYSKCQMDTKVIMKSKIKSLLAAIFSVILLLTLARCGFILYVASEGSDPLSLWAFGHTLLWGLRYDWATVVALNLPLILLYRWGGVSPWRYLLRGYYVIINTSLLFLNIVDIPLYTFTQRRMTVDVVYTLSDAWQQLGSLLSDYGFFPVVGLLLALVFLRFLISSFRFRFTYRKMNREIYSQK